MKSLTLIIAAILTCNICSIAQSTPKKEAIIQLLAVMHQDSLMFRMMNQMSASMAASMSANLKTINMSDTAYNSTAKKIIDKNMESIKAILSRMVKEDMVDIYDKYFTMQEIQDFTTFYKSKSGQQLLNKSPDLSKDLMTIMTTKYGPELQQSMMKSAEEMKNDR
jgi:hypothetical protein